MAIIERDAQVRSLLEGAEVLVGIARITWEVNGSALVVEAFVCVGYCTLDK